MLLLVVVIVMHIYQCSKELNNDYDINSKVNEPRAAEFSKTHKTPPNVSELSKYATIYGVFHYEQHDNSKQLFDPTRFPPANNRTTEGPKRSPAARRFSHLPVSAWPASARWASAGGGTSRWATRRRGRPPAPAGRRRGPPGGGPGPTSPSPWRRRVSARGRRLRRSWCWTGGDGGGGALLADGVEARTTGAATVLCWGRMTEPVYAGTSAQLCRRYHVN